MLTKRNYETRRRVSHHAKPWQLGHRFQGDDQQLLSLYHWLGKTASDGYGCSGWH